MTCRGWKMRVLVILAACLACPAHPQASEGRVENKKPASGASAAAAGADDSAGAETTWAEGIVPSASEGNPADASAAVESATTALKTFDTGFDAEADIEEMLDEWTWVTNDIEEGRKQFEATYPRVPEVLKELQASESKAGEAQSRLANLRDELSRKAEDLAQKARAKQNEELALGIEAELGEGRKWTGDLEADLKSHKEDVASSIKALEAWQKDQEQHAREAVGMTKEVEEAVKEVHKNAADPNIGSWREEARGRLNNMLEVSTEYKELAAKLADDVTVSQERIESVQYDLQLLEEQGNEWRSQIEERTGEVSE